MLKGVPCRVAACTLHRDTRKTPQILSATTKWISGQQNFQTSPCLTLTPFATSTFKWEGLTPLRQQKSGSHSEFDFAIRRRALGFLVAAKGTRRVLWLTWLWGNVRWEGRAL